MRKEVKNENYKLVYGDDHIEGFFYEVWSCDDVLIESGSRQYNPLLTIQIVATLVEAYGFELSDELPEETINYD